MPTLMGFDSDDERSLGEVGREGVAIDHVDDLHAVLRRDRHRADLGLDDDQPLGLDPARDVPRRRRGARAVPREQLSGTTQADIVKEYVAQKEWIYPVGRRFGSCAT